MKQMDARFIEIAKEIAESCCATWRSYSGRGMYGRQCFGIVTDNGLSFVQELAYTCGEEGLRMPERINSDSMGLDMIVYWPGVEFTMADENGPDDEEEEE
jgi:hypothetical protein